MCYFLQFLLLVSLHIYANFPRWSTYTETVCKKVWRRFSYSWRLWSRKLLSPIYGYRNGLQKGFEGPKQKPGRPGRTFLLPLLGTLPITFDLTGEFWYPSRICKLNSSPVLMEQHHIPTYRPLYRWIWYPIGGLLTFFIDLAGHFTGEFW